MNPRIAWRVGYWAVVDDRGVMAAPFDSIAEASTWLDEWTAPVTGDQVRQSPVFAALSPEAREVIARSAEEAS
jgi:hypothetical protein